MNRKAHLPVNNPGLLFFLLIAVSLWLTACQQLDVFEKDKSIPQNQWQYALQPSFDFIIKDTSASYNVYIVLRHTDAYRYNNIWLNVGIQWPGDKIRFQKVEKQLGNDAQGWKGTGMDDIWEIRSLLTETPYKFTKAGNYHFTVAQIMRENPLPNIMSVGIRVEKVR